jgi:hypothetical protein
MRLAKNAETLPKAMTVRQALGFMAKPKAVTPKIAKPKTATVAGLPPLPEGAPDAKKGKMLLADLDAVLYDAIHIAGAEASLDVVNRRFEDYGLRLVGEILKEPLVSGHAGIEIK